MHWIIEFIFNHRNGTSFVLAILLSSLLLNATDSEQVQIAKYLGSTLFLPVQVTVNQVSKFRNIFSENESLRKRIQELEIENASLEQTVSKSDVLIGEVAYRDTSSYDLIPSEVVVREPNFLYRTVVIDVGKIDGVEPYMPVVSIDGVVGKVIRVLDKSSLVQLIRKPDEFVSVIHREASAIGILNAIGNNRLQVEFRKHQDLKIGDTLFTSGFGGIYPPGLPVATIISIEDAQNPLYNSVFVQPTVNFDALRNLFVLALSTQWQAYQQELDSLIRGGLE